MVCVQKYGNTSVHFGSINMVGYAIWFMSLYCITTCLTLFDQGKLMTAINDKVNNNASREVPLEVKTLY